MRNAPVDAAHRVPFLIGGQRLSAGLPWYRGPAGAPMQAEAQALCALVEQELLGRRFSLAVDCHSGFGVQDRIWFPFAHTARPIEHLPEMHALCAILDQTLAHHRYVFEPQSRQYLAHGDLWDHLYRRACADPGRVFLPLTLEMGSWLWIKKNPRQLFSRHGIFNPLIGHRQQRVLRRHLGWLDFVTRAAASHARRRQPRALAADRRDAPAAPPAGAGALVPRGAAVSPAPSTWVLLRGLTREQRHWGAFPEQLRAALPGAAIVTLDLPGNGVRHRERSPASVEALADDARAALRVAGRAPPYRLLALSLGAMVAVAWAARHPQELRGAVLVNTSLRPYSPFHQRLRPGCYAPLLRLALGAPSDAEREATILRLTAQHPPAPDALLRDWAAWRRDAPVSRANGLRQLLAAARYRAPAEPPALPLLLLASTRDALVDVRCSRRLAAAWQADFAEHASAGHDLPLDAGPWVAEQLRRWVDGPGAAPQSGRPAFRSPS